MKNNSQLQMTGSPFALGNDDLYRRWRERKLNSYPKKIDDLIVEVSDPRRLSNNEYMALLGIAQKKSLTFGRLIKTGSLMITD